MSRSSKIKSEQPLSMLSPKRPYFGIHGSDAEGWELMKYEYELREDAMGSVVETGTLRPAWVERKPFDSLTSVSDFIRSETI